MPGQLLENLNIRATLLLLIVEAASPPLKDLSLTQDPLGPDSFAKYLLSFDAIKASQSEGNPEKWVIYAAQQSLVANKNCI